jgi:hypothetical protein
MHVLYINYLKKYSNIFGVYCSFMQIKNGGLPPIFSVIASPWNSCHLIFREFLDIAQVNVLLTGTVTAAIAKEQ